MRVLLAAAVILGLLSSVVYAYPTQPTCDDLEGRWENQLGSTLIIKSVHPTTGQIGGAYSSPSGTGGQEYPMVGWVNGLPPVAEQHNARVVSFTVRWGEIGSITAWNGICETVDGDARLTTLWHLARPNSNFVWDHVLTGSDVFRPITTPRRPR